jgi:hypothetical protein
MTTPFPFVAGQVLTAAQLNDIQNLPISDKTASYTLVATDVFKRTIMNNAGATTITVDDSIFTVGDVIQVANKGAGTCTITAGAGVTINTSGSLALAQYGGGYLVAISASQFVFFNLGSGATYGVATGGTSSTPTIGGIDYTVLTFTSDDNLVVSKSGLFDVLLVAGGGAAGGGTPTDRCSSGGGGGGVVGLTTLTTIYLEAATYAVDVGAGGAATAEQSGQTGFSSSIGSTIISAAGGGRGTFGAGTENNFKVEGGSNGGTSNNSVAATKTIVNGQGNLGGRSTATTNAGGGGGFGSAGGNGSTTTGGAGGNGSEINGFTGGASTIVSAGGGGSGTVTGGAAGTGGVAGVTTGAGNSGVNPGAGGGGNESDAVPGSGAAGLVVVRFES